MMDLVLWRHAEAEDGGADLERRLTAKGVKQARSMAQWLRSQLPKKTRVIVSPAERAKQTARALTDDFEILQQIAPGAHHGAIFTAAGWPDANGTVLVVGHQPVLGEAAAFLLFGREMPLSVKKGAIWWFSQRTREGADKIVLRAVLAPDMV